MKKILLTFALMVGIAFAHPPHHKRVPPPPPPRYVSAYTVVTPNGHIEYVRPRKPMYVVLPQMQTNPAGTMIYDRDDYTVNIFQSL